jgi:hypothetical protein
VERYLRHFCSLQERREAPLAQVGWVNQRPGFGAKDKALIFVDISESLYLR